ncbi:hypothetical protein BGZ76_008595 [Entomortierella beljakovae]|nr:hypothetical protein BGZ76_008595 [Entomortierella beljakovae]
MATAAASGPSSTSVATPSTPLSISIPRQRSFSSSFSLANSPRGFTGSSIIANPSNGFLNSTAFGGPLASPTTASFSSSNPPTSSGASLPSSQTMPVLHRRFSSSFGQLNQIVGTSPTNASAQQTERGRRTSLFGGSSPPSISVAATTATQSPAESNPARPGLFRKFSSGRAGPLDRNDAGPTNVGPPQPNSNASSIVTSEGQYQITAASTATLSGNNNHLSAVDKLKPSHDKHSRSSSPMRSMILNGQMLD